MIRNFSNLFDIQMDILEGFLDCILCSFRINKEKNARVSTQGSLQ
jgi:hypothetical protein